jgi:hypothetical protein
MPTFTWQTIKTGVKSPGPRSRHGLVYDRGAGAIVLFAGIVWVGEGQLQSDTWELKDGEWSPVEVSERPPARHRGAMAFDERRATSILFGGQADNGAMLGDTWFYARRRWRRWKSWWGRCPEPRCGHSLAYDAKSGKTVLFGGIGGGDQTLGDTWVFDGHGWRELRPDPSPPPRRYAAIAYDPGLQGCLLHGGSVDDVGRHQFGDAWLFRDGGWARLPAGFDTDVRDDHGLAYHGAARAMVMLDGIRSARGLLTATAEGWEPAPAEPMHPRHQCSPLVWDDGLEGLVLHGGEARHAGPQLDATLILRLTSAPES